MDEIFTNDKGFLKGQEFLPTIFYSRFKIQKNNDHTSLKTSQLKYMGEFNKDSERFIFKAWMSFLRAKHEFMKGELSIKEVYETKNEKLGLNNFGFIDLARSIFRLVRLDEQHIDQINFQKLRADCSYVRMADSIFSIKIPEKDKFVYFRNAIAHNMYTLTIKDGIPKINIVLGPEGNERSMTLKFSEFVNYVNLAEQYIDENVEKYFKSQKKKKAFSLYKKLFKIGQDDSLSEEKMQILNFIYDRNTKPATEIKWDVNTKFNDLILEYPEFKKREILDLLYQEIRQSYSEFDKDGNFVKANDSKLQALQFIENERMMRAEDVLEVAEYVFSTNRYKTFEKNETSSKEFLEFFRNKFDAKKIVTENKLSIKDNQSYNSALLENIRHSIFHDKVIFDLEGNIIFRGYDVKGKKTEKKFIKKLKKRKLSMSNEHYLEELHFCRSKYSAQFDEIKTICKLTPDELIKLCNIIMKGGSVLLDEKDQDIYTKKQKNKPKDPRKIINEYKMSVIHQEVFGDEKNDTCENMEDNKKIDDENEVE